MTVLPLHIIAGSTAIVSGFLALCARKGAKLHRQSGMIFVYSMFLLCGSAALLATAVKPNAANLLQAALAFYLVSTALLAVARSSEGFRSLEVTAMMLALVVGIAHITFGFEALHSTTGRRYGYPPPLYFTFGPLALLAVVGDLRMMALGGLQGMARMARHLWRMCLAMFIASASFFFGQAKLIPQSIRIFPLLAVPALLPLGIMLYWLARVWFTKTSAAIGQGDLPTRPENNRLNQLIEPSS